MLWITVCVVLVASVLAAAGAGAFGIIRYQGPTTAVAEPPSGGAVAEAPNGVPAPDRNGDQTSPGTPQGRSTPRPRVAATTEAVVNLLVKLLPPGKVEWVYREESPLSAYVAFTRNGIATYIHVRLEPFETPAPGDPLKNDPNLVGFRSCTAVTDTGQCTILPSGAVVRVYQNRSCLAQIDVIVDRPGFRLELLGSRCNDANVPNLTDTGDETKPRTVLDPAEAALIAGSDEWGLTMRPDLVVAGREKYPALPQVPPTDVFNS